MNRIYLELGAKKVFACSLDWPGWCRAGKSEEPALDRLLDYAPRYRVVAERAGLDFDPGAPTVVERLDGRSATDFGIPEVHAKADHEPLTEAEAGRQVAIMRAAWELFDERAAASPEELRKGPRGGGRDRTKMVEHVEEAERGYARILGVKHPPYRSRQDRDALREELAAVLSRPWTGPWEPKWTPRYALRRITWHVLDHLWEMEDRRT
ncbi:hypothetical protein [Thermoactinospora rubra]|uniref:hypothetical protein n=1 Tax=Thermoactinospora rubra TaxID=1088767 RepID=UPI000A0F6A49|nr:hypothetical protein [Thermoactinospora rubra]